MNTHPCYIVDAFTQEPFRGNQAAVCLISKVQLDIPHLKIASEFNLSETAFPVPLDGDYRTASKFSLRWFTPTVEVPLCGHATLATSHVLFYEVGNQNEKISFTTKSGTLTVNRSDNGTVSMNFPQYGLVSVRLSSRNVKEQAGFPVLDPPDDLSAVVDHLVPSTMNIEAIAYAPDAKKLIVVLDGNTTRQQLEALNIQHKQMKDAHAAGDFVRGAMVTVKPNDPKAQGFLDNEGKPYDYASRYFAPWVGINEDPATGSAQCALAPYWSAILKRDDFYALQAYPNRGAEFLVHLQPDDRIILRGKSKTIVEGKIHL